MEKNLEEELNARYQYGKTGLAFGDTLEAATYGDSIIGKYMNHPKLKPGESELRIATVHKDNLIALAKAILELKGWLRTNKEQTHIRQIIQKRFIDLSTILRFQTASIKIIAGMPVMNMFISEGITDLNTAIKIANEILRLNEEITTFIEKI